MQNRANFFINSTNQKQARIKKKDGNTIQLTPIRVYTLVTGFEDTTNISAKIGSKNLHHSIERDTANLKQKDNIYAFADGHWVFFKVVSRGNYELYTYAEMNDHYNKSDTFTSQASYSLKVN